MLQSYWKLYVSEIKRNKILFIFEMIALLGYFWGFVTITTLTIDFLHDAFSDLSIPLFIMTISTLPMIIYFSFTLERNNSRNYMLFSLPLRKKTLLIFKFVTLLTPVVVMPFLFVCLVSGWGLFTVYNSPISFHELNVRYLFLIRNNFEYLFYFVFFLSSAIFISGIISVAESIKFSIKRYKAVLIFVFLMCSQFVMIWSVRFILLFGDLGNYLNHAQLTPMLTVEFLWQNMIIMNIYVSVIGFLFICSGLFIFEKYAEV